MYTRKIPNESDYLTKITIDNALDENGWLFDAQYWAGHPLTKIFWPREILDLEPIDFEGLEYKPLLKIEKIYKEDRN